MSNEMTIIPQLRFPEFLEKEGWEIKEVGEIFQVTRGYVLSMTLVKELPTEEYLYPVFSSQTKNNGLAGYYNEYLYEDAITWTTDGANAGDVNYREGKFYCTNVCGVLLNEEGYANSCIAELINSVSKKHVSYVGNPKLMNGVMSKIEIPVPSIPEQQKIASCISSLDELIAAHNYQLDALKDHKKGLMQNLFPQEGETLPKFRFKEFKYDGEWVEKKLNFYLELLTDFESNGSFADVKNNVTVYDEEKYAWYVRATDLENNTDLSKVKYVDKHSYDFLHKTQLFGGELLITKRGEIGKVYIYNSIGNLHATVAPNMYLLKLNKKAIPLFFFYHFTNFIGNHSLRRLNASSTIGALYKDDVKKLELLAPPTIEEQQKIASCLSAVDDLISAQIEKIEQLQQHKKGLMQGLFPKIES